MKPRRYPPSLEKLQHAIPEINDRIRFRKQPQQALDLRKPAADSAPADLSMQKPATHYFCCKAIRYQSP